MSSLEGFLNRAFKIGHVFWNLVQTFSLTSMLAYRQSCGTFCLVVWCTSWVHCLELLFGSSAVILPPFVHESDDVPNFQPFPTVSTAFLRQVGALPCQFSCSKLRSIRFHGFSLRHFVILSIHAFKCPAMMTLRDNSYSYFGPAVLLVPAWLKN